VTDNFHKDEFQRLYMAQWSLNYCLGRSQPALDAATV